MSALDSIPHAIADGPHERRLGIRWWLLAAATGAVLVIGYLSAAGLIALVLATASGAQFDPAVVLVAALPGWLVLHQTPLEIMGAPLSVLPLLPTALMMLLIAAASSWVARRSRLRRPDQAWPLIATMGLVHAFFGTGIAVVLDGPVNAVPVDAFLSCGLAATIASAAGVANRCGLIYLWWERVEAEVWSGMRLGLLALAALIGAGGVVLLLGICVSAPEMAAALARSGDAAGDAIGSALLSISYLPNAVVAGWSFAAGTGFSTGRLAVQPLHATTGPVPDLALFAVLPTQGSSAWWAIVLALPVVVGVLVGAASRRVSGILVRRLRAVGVAAVVAALGTLVLAWVAGGDLGNGPFGTVTLRPVLLAVATLCWVVVPAAAVTWLAGRVDDDTDDFGATDPATGGFVTGDLAAGDSAAGEESSTDSTGDTENEDGEADSADTEANADADGTSDDASIAEESDDGPAEDIVAAVDAIFEKHADDPESDIPYGRTASHEDLSKREPAESEPAESDPTEFDADVPEDDQR